MSVDDNRFVGGMADARRRRGEAGRQQQVGFSENRLGLC